MKDLHPGGLWLPLLSYVVLKHHTQCLKLCKIGLRTICKSTVACLTPEMPYLQLKTTSFCQRNRRHAASPKLSISAASRTFCCISSLACWRMPVSLNSGWQLKHCNDLSNESCLEMKVMLHAPLASYQDSDLSDQHAFGRMSVEFYKPQQWCTT